MKYFKISSPAYRANGFHGTYFSIAICEENGDFFKVFGDHARACISDQFFYPEYINVFDISGMPFSDSDRFIQIEEVKVDIALLTNWETSYREYRRLSEEWYKMRQEMFGLSVYDFIYDKKGRIVDENNAKYQQWIKSHPAPVAVAYYDFMKAIIRDEN